MILEGTGKSTKGALLGDLLAAQNDWDSYLPKAVGDLLKSATGALANIPEITVGRYTGVTSTDVTVTLPFDPFLMLVKNATDAGGSFYVVWHDGTSVEGIEIPVAGPPTTVILDATDFTFGAAGEKKFVAKTGGQANTNAKVYSYIAIGK